MKSFFKIMYLMLLILSSSISIANAQNAIVITYDSEINFAHRVKETFIKLTSIPSNLISLKWQASPCESIRDAILQICMKNDGEMDFPVINKDKLNNSFKIFNRNTQET